MSEVLSQDEINKLLKLISDEEPEIEEKIEKKRYTRIYDFARPDLLVKKDLKKLINYFENLKIEGFIFKELDAASYSYFNYNTNSSVYLKGSDNQNKNKIIIGGLEEYNVQELEEIETFTKKVFVGFGEFYTLNPSYVSCKLYQDNPHGLVITIEYKSKVFYIFIEKKDIVRVFSNYAEPKQDLANANIEVSVLLGKTSMTIKEIQDLKDGSIIELNKIAGEPVEVFAGNSKIGVGEVVVVDETFGVRMLVDED